MRSRAFPWFGERKLRGLFCCVSPIEPGLNLQSLATEQNVTAGFSETTAYVNEELSKLVIGSTLTEGLRPGSYNAALIYQEYAERRTRIFRAAFVLHFMKQQDLESWARYMELYGTPEPWKQRGRKIIEHPSFGMGKHQGPKWGQPGRRRRRKARMQAIANEKEMRTR